ncbi:MAG: response regulator [Candidatus Omnitrophota bacterium]
MANILIVDDAVFMRKMLSDVLTKDGHKVVGEAENAKEAINIYKKLKPDIVTLDIIMPEVEGVDSMKAIKELLNIDSNAKIIMVSAMGQQELVVEAIQAGAKDFIVKPFQPSRVTEAVNRLVKK